MVIATQKYTDPWRGIYFFFEFTATNCVLISSKFVPAYLAYAGLTLFSLVHVMM